MSIAGDLLTAGAFLMPIGLAVGGLHLLGRRRRAAANEFDLWAPHEPAVELTPVVVVHDQAVVPERRDWPIAHDHVEQAIAAPAERIWPAAALTEPVGLAAWEVQWTPPYAELVLAQVVRRHGVDAQDIARRWLREIGDVQRAKAGIRPIVSPASDRDFTGAFAVVAVA
ncbi:hypothetical protein OOJ91_13945 [Micromonospora lupini]|uniref:hypothetical protein n=1 Tax=Micromonospora lupini TaxID=285679 RepID=UPI00224DE380|nr:hypothetical protein [Micromonospora lupini]MCX5066950.1 hypothetical protein [Micromonospora lupini]